MEEVVTVGMPVRNECMSVYLSLFINEVHSSGSGDNLGLVDSGFIGHLEASGFGDVERWLTNKGVQMIPAFFGPHNYCHWTALILDSESGHDQQKAAVAIVDNLACDNLKFIFRQDGSVVVWNTPKSSCCQFLEITENSNR